MTVRNSFFRFFTSPKKPRRIRVRLAALLLGFAVFLTACNVFGSDPTLTPIFITATPRVLVITNTPTLAATPVLAPTLPPDEEVALNPPTITPSPTTAITLTPTFTITPTDTPVTPGAQVFVPFGVQPAANLTCPNPPQGGFGIIYNSNTSLAAQLSCPISGFGALSVISAYQTFERGFMIYVSSVGSTGQPGIYVIYSNNTYQRFADTWRDGVDPTSTGQTPPGGGLFEPIRGFGKVWRESGGVRDGLGWATSQEVGDTGSFIQLFERGEMIYMPQTRRTYVLVTGAPGTWTAFDIPYN